MQLSSSPITWIVSGVALTVVAQFNDYAFVASIERYLFTTMLTIITLSFTAFSLTMNNLVELCKSRKEVKVRAYIEEVEENIRFMFGGLAICFFAVLLKNSFPDGFCSKDVWDFVLNSFILSVVTMYIMLVKDVAEAYFILLKDIYQ